MNIKMLRGRSVIKGIILESGKTYQVIEKLEDEYKVRVKNKFVIVRPDECEVIKENLLSRIKNILKV